MINQRGLPNPWDELSALAGMKDKLIAEYSRAEIDTFFDEKANKALQKFFRSVSQIVSEIVGVTVDLSRFGASWEGNFPYHEMIVDTEFYAARSVGITIRRTDLDLEVFYYFFYAMSRPNVTSKPYCVYTKVNGGYNVLHQVNTVTVDDLFERVKSALIGVRHLLTES